MADAVLRTPSTEGAEAAAAAAYAQEILDLLFGLLDDVIQVRQPEIAPVLHGAIGIPQGRHDLLLKTLQAWGIGFQLTTIAEQNATMRRLRQTERSRGADKVEGTFAYVFAEAAAAGVKPEAIQALLQQARIRPVITAHPTEAKRVTVLEIHRRIYVLLMQIESERWTLRERQAFVDALS